MSLVAEIDPVDVELDKAQTFMLFATFAGDVVRTAHAAGVRPVDILKVAEAEGWMEKLKPIIELQKSQKPGDLERAMNRAINYVQAHKLRLFLERIMSRICGMNETDLREYLFQGETKLNKAGEPVSESKKLSTRPLADLAAALEKVHSMTYLALGDLSSDRARRKESSDLDQSDAGALHIRIAAGMAKVKENNSLRGQLLDDQLATAARVLKEAKRESPLDSDDH